MLLAVDSGNTNIVFGVHDGQEWRGKWRSSTKSDRTADEFAVWMTQLFAIEDLDRTSISAAIISNVVPAATHSLVSLCRSHFNVEPLVIGTPEVELGIDILIDHPDDPGADRLVNAVGAFMEHGGPLIIVDFGTATTFDVIDENGNYCGGVIAPAAAHSVDALHRAAAQLPRVDVKRPATVVGRSTVSAMESGIYWGYVGLIEGLVAHIKREVGGDMTVVATGGLAPVFTKASEAIDKLDPDVTLRGLHEIHRRNRG